MKNLQQHIIEWLDSIGADGLMNNTHGGISIYEKDEIETALNVYEACQLVPAYRHADGTWHAESEDPSDCLGIGCCEPREEKCEEIEKIVHEIYCDLDLDGQEDWDRVATILYKAFPKPAPVQSAEDFALEVWEDMENDLKHSAKIKIEKRDAAQRQAGREEAQVYITELECEVGEYHEIRAKEVARYAALVESTRELEKVMTEACEYFLSANGSRPDIAWIKAVLEARKALREIDEAKGE